MILESTNPTVIPTSGKHFQMMNIYIFHSEKILGCIHLLTRLTHTIVAYFRNVPISELNSWGESFEHLMNSESKLIYIKKEILEFNLIQS